MRKAMIWIVIMLVLGMALNISAQAAGTESGIVSQAVNGVVQVYAQTQMSNGRELGATGSAFGVGTIGEETDIFVTNRHVVTEENQDGSLTQAQRVYIMVGENTLTTTQRSVLSGGELYLRDDLPTVYDINTDRMIPCQVLYVSEDYDFDHDGMPETTELVTVLTPDSRVSSATFSRTLSPVSLRRSMATVSSAVSLMPYRV